MTEWDIKKNLNREVSHKGEGGYILTGGIIRKDKKTNEFYYQAELLDTRTGNCVVYVRLKEVEPIECTETYNPTHHPRSNSITVAGE